MAILDECNVYLLVMALIGILSILSILFDTFINFAQTSRALLAPYFLPYETQSLVKRYGSWALVTGSTDGIGKAYAKELARRGLGIVLVSRNIEKLKETASEIESEFGVKTKIIAADFTLGPKAIEIVKNELGALPIGILINNVGMQYEYPMYLGEVPEERIWNIINVNCGAATLLCRLLINEMKNNKKGAIVNVCSGAECQPLPLLNVYSSSKAYLSSFTEALRYEYSKYGITVQHLSPLFVNTKMNKFSDRLQKNSFFVPDATMYAEYAVETLGKVDHSTGYWTHGIQYFFITLPPMKIRMYIGGVMNRMFRRDYLDKIITN